jgi:hypothetical protein
MSAYRGARTTPRQGRPVLAIGLIALVAIALGFILGSLFRGEDGEAAGGSPSASASTSALPSTSASPAPSAAASASGPASAVPAPSGPPPVVAAPEGLIPPGSIVRVATDGLRMRENPSTESTLVADLPVEELLIVGYGPQRSDWGPVSAGGFAWYPVVRTETNELPPLPEMVGGTSEFGWVAAGDEAEAYIQLVEPRCPARPADLITVEAMLPWEQLACFGSEPIPLEGTYGCSGCGGLFPGTFEPAWLAHPGNFDLLSTDISTRLGPFALHFPPDGPAVPPVGQIVRVVGHFDDAAAARCSVSPGEPPTPIDPQTVVLYCREQFVVETVEVIGPDPEWPSG